MLKVYGISNCDKMKKVISQLKKSGIEHEFYNFKKVLPTKDLIIKWKDHLNEWPINKRGTTYRKLKEEFEAGNDTSKLDIIISNSSMIKRPIAEWGSEIISIGDVSAFNDFIEKKI